MTQCQKKITAVWIVAAVGIIVVLMAGRAFFGKPAGDVEQTGAAGGHMAQAATTQLTDIVASRKTWDPEFSSWFGKDVGDLAVTDLSGKEHRLSDYRGKTVLVVFWATWCPACNMEIPDLIKLRKEYTPEKLEILAISNESTDIISDFARARGINYTVATLSEPLPEPFSGIAGIPTSFFIDAEGKLKLAAAGVVPLEEAVEIINAR